MIRRPSDLWHATLLSEYRRLANLSGPPVTMQLDIEEGTTHFRCSPNVESPYFRFCREGQDYAGLLATVCWLREGPKIVNVTEEQFQALSNIEVRLSVADFSMPYPTMLVNMPEGKMHRCVILHRRETADDAKVSVLVGVSVSHDHTHDIVNVVRQSESEIEESLGKFYGEVTSDEMEETRACLRVACNMALAMANFGCQSEYLFPKEVAAERKFILKGDRAGKSGRTASDRLHEQPMLVYLDRSVKLYHREGGTEASETTGNEMPFHWRRGHWHTVLHGKGKTQRRLVLYPPTMVRADLMLVAAVDTTTTYRR